MSVWLLLNANSEIFQLFHGENKLIFKEMIMMSALCKTNTLSWTSIVLAHWNDSPLIDMSPHLDISSWFLANHSFSFMLRVSGEATNIIVFGFDPIRAQSMIYRTWGEHANHYTTDVVDCTCCWSIRSQTTINCALTCHNNSWHLDINFVQR